MNDMKTSRIKCEKSGLSIFENDDWPEMVNFLIDVIIRLEKALQVPIKEVNKILKNGIENIHIGEENNA
ncbi:hypothetical protein SPSIL_014390 [Sporomusa silvacetica DSM 10669]|uniref:MazG nucleotide pyrophosphohydrolase domain protein n=1 Tax=Sporomusa silvacetica DSM 10669 TaxID=1123289 RepID=A0ABZ3II52_9FIRM|nr:hypothetical protein [Sporomusa silvacetica]OZC21502.1 hypothetical protein SPSIL_09120 [Sporomusa silvacetica DSM 10669]